MPLRARPRRRLRLPAIQLRRELHTLSLQPRTLTRVAAAAAAAAAVAVAAVVEKRWGKIPNGEKERGGAARGELRRLRGKPAAGRSSRGHLRPPP